MSLPSPPPGPDGPGCAANHLKRFRNDYERFLRELFATYGDIVALPVGQHRVCLLNDPAFIQQVFVHEWQSFRKPDTLHASNRGYWGDGLTSLEGAAWLRMRRLLQPAFQPRLITGFAPMIVECARDMVAAWRPGVRVHVPGACMNLIARIAARTVLDADVERHATASGACARSGFIPPHEIRGEQFAVPFLRGETGAIPMVRLRAGRRMDGSVSLIKQRLALRETHADMLSALLGAAEQTGQTLSEEEVVGEMIQMLFAGHLNLPRAFESIWLALAEHPDAEGKLHAELERVLGGRQPGAEDLPNLWYTAMVIKEAMRLYTPPGMALHREVITPVQLGGYLLEPGTLVWVELHQLHRNPRSFAEPERFWPERFGPEREAMMPKYGFIPFGAGPRTCIANGFAMMEMLLITAVVAQAYRLALLPGEIRRGAVQMQVIAR